MKLLICEKCQLVPRLLRGETRCPHCNGKLTGGSTSKYRNKKTVVNGITFGSKKEAERYQTLVQLQKAGVISGLKPHPKYLLVVNGVRIGTYTADSRYYDHEAGEGVVEDVKSKATMTTSYRLRKRLMLAIHKIQIKEV